MVGGGIADRCGSVSLLSTRPGKPSVELARPWSFLAAVLVRAPSCRVFWSASLPVVAVPHIRLSKLSPHCPLPPLQCPSVAAPGVLESLMGSPHVFLLSHLLGGLLHGAALGWEVWKAGGLSLAMKPSPAPLPQPYTVLQPLQTCPSLLLPTAQQNPDGA